MTKHLITGIVSFFIAFGSLSHTVKAAELLMFRELGCYWCEKWDTEIGDIYPKTTEGKKAPLREVDIQKPVPDFIADRGLVHFTPTFVLVENGQEVGRITGYPGEDAFWWLLEKLASKLPE